MSDLKYIDAKEFMDIGFLQEANRLFFHPRGLAMEVVKNDDGTYRYGKIWDYRDDPEGIIFDNLGSQEARDKADRVNDEVYKHRAHRIALLGTVIQEVK